MSEVKSAKRVLSFSKKATNDRTADFGGIEGGATQIKTGRGQAGRTVTGGKARLIGTSSGDGVVYDFYRIDSNGQVTYIFDVKS